MRNVCMAKKKKPQFKRIVLDLGCGTGNVTEYMARGDKTTFYIGIDVDVLAIKKAQKKYGHHPNMSFILADASKMPIKAGKIDAARARFLFPYLKRAKYLDEKRQVVIETPTDRTFKRVVKETFRVLKEGGELKTLIPSYGEESMKGKKALAESKFVLKRGGLWHFALKKPKAKRKR